MKTKSTLYLTLTCWFWAGMVAAISFMEAPVKFTAPSLSLQVGLDVGRHVFGAFNKVEIVLGALMLIAMIVARPVKRNIILPAVVLVLLLLETAWLLPALDARALKVMAGETPPSTYHHILYVVFETVKLFGLIISGAVFFNVSRNKGTAHA